MLNIDLLFYFFALLLVGSATVVVLSSQTVFSLLALILCFIVAALLLFLIECEFLGLIFIVIYVGAIAVLFLFAVMMLEVKLVNLNSNKIKHIPIGVFFSLGLLFPILYKISSHFTGHPYPHTFYLNNYLNWYDLIDSISDVEVYGQVLYTYFVLQFLVAGLILLLVLVGAIYLTNNFNTTQRREQPIFKQLSRNSKFF